MQTPVNDMLAAIFSWVVFYANLIFLTVVIPNAARAIVGDIPRLAVDRSFFAMATLFALIITFAINEWWKRSKDTVKNFHKSDRRKHLELNGVLTAAFIGGALLTYFSGIDNSIYNNMMQA